MKIHAILSELMPASTRLPTRTSSISARLTASISAHATKVAGGNHRREGQRS